MCPQVSGPYRARGTDGMGHLGRYVVPTLPRRQAGVLGLVLTWPRAAGGRRSGLGAGQRLEEEEVPAGSEGRVGWEVQGCKEREEEEGRGEKAPRGGEL